jgi:hypothetical protein
MGLQVIPPLINRLSNGSAEKGTRFAPLQFGQRANGYKMVGFLRETTRWPVGQGLGNLANGLARSQGDLRSRHVRRLGHAGVHDPRTTGCVLPWRRGVRCSCVG